MTTATAKTARGRSRSRVVPKPPPRKKTKAVKAAPKKKSGKVEIPELCMEVSQFPIKGIDGPLVVHNWSEKAIAEMLAKQMHVKTKAKEPKNPEEHYLSSLYVGEDETYGFPATGFKAAIVRAADAVDGLAMKATRQLVFVLADMKENREFQVQLGEDEVFKQRITTPLVRIYGEPQMRMDMVRLPKGGTDVRFRAEFNDWEATVTLRYHAARISPTEVANLLNIAGQTVGIGEGRPEKGADMTWGRFEVLVS